MKMIPLIFLLSFFLSCAKSGFNPESFNGTYNGIWKTATGVEGPASIAIVVNIDGTFNLTLDFDGNYLGLGDPPANPMVGTYNDDGAQVKGTNPFYGTTDVTINTQGDMVGTFLNVGMGMFPKLTYNGVITDKRIDATYETFKHDGTSSMSTLTLSK